MGESIDAMKKRLEFMKNERQQKQAELERLAKESKSTGTRSFLHAILGDNIATQELELQHMTTRAEDIKSQIRKLDFEIQQLESDLENRKTTSPALGRIFCRYCGVENETDAIFCKKCGKNMT